MGFLESEIVQPIPATYADYVGNLVYDDDISGGDELPLATLDMELGDVPMPLVQVNGEFIEIFSFLIVF
jgi:hypothetical protein